ncbi:hypothetical protein PS6_004784 [Mucor atramentarius]
MAILQDAVARQNGELERIQAKGMVGGVVTAKLDFSKTKGLPKCMLDQVSATNVVPSGKLNKGIAT